MFGKNYYKLILICLLLSSCVAQVLTGTQLVYDRHHVYHKVDDFQLAASANRVLYHDGEFKYSDCSIEVTAFHGDLLVLGRVPTEDLLSELNKRLSGLPGKRRYLNAVRVTHEFENTVQDAWITTSIRSRILANSDIDPGAFKVVTFDNIVYLMGDVMPDQAEQVVHIARSTNGVQKVIKLLHYYYLKN